MFVWGLQERPVLTPAPFVRSGSIFVSSGLRVWYRDPAQEPRRPASREHAMVDRREHAMVDRREHAMVDRREHAMVDQRERAMVDRRERAKVDRRESQGFEGSRCKGACFTGFVKPGTPEGWRIGVAGASVCRCVRARHGANLLPPGVPSAGSATDSAGANGPWQSRAALPVRPRRRQRSPGGAVAAVPVGGAVAAVPVGGAVAAVPVDAANVSRDTVAWGGARSSRGARLQVADALLRGRRRGAHCRGRGDALHCRGRGDALHCRGRGEGVASRGRSAQGVGAKPELWPEARALVKGRARSPGPKNALAAQGLALPEPAS
jgi:hypothetical protein